MGRKSASVNRKAAVFLAVIMVIISGCSGRAAGPDIPAGTAPASETAPSDAAPSKSGAGYIKYLECIYFNDRDFQTHVAKAENFHVETLSAGMVPHHLLAGELIASFFKTAKESGENYDAVIILGPNHRGTGADVSIADCGWSTRFGAAECDRDVVDEIFSCKPLSARIDNELLQSDHSVSSLIPYVKYYLPDAKVVTVLLTRRVSLEQAENIAGVLGGIANVKKCLVVGSVDFSHGLSVRDAVKKDRETQKAIENFDFESIKKMSNENFDSPEVLCTLLYYMKQRCAHETQVLCHKNAADFINNPQLQDCTTYFVLGSP